MIKPIIRPAQNHEAEIVRLILEMVGLIPEGLDWSEIYPSWLVAEHKGMIIGCVQVLPGKPLGHIGFLAVVPKYQYYGYGVLLLKAAERLLGNMGCDGFTSLTDHPHILRKMDKLGFTKFGPMVNWFFKRVQRKENVDVLQENLH